MSGDYLSIFAAWMDRCLVRMATDSGHYKLKEEYVDTIEQAKLAG